jgi:DNA-binding HxlR family transcriptional regulator
MKIEEMEQKKAVIKPRGCEQTLMAIKDTMELLSGKWKIQIVGSLMMNRSMRFMDLIRDVNGIAAKMLSKELQELEVNELISRTVKNTKPVTVEYELTEHGRSLGPLINEVAKWGSLHRNKLFNTSFEPMDLVAASLYVKSEIPG